MMITIEELTGFIQKLLVVDLRRKGLSRPQR
jgi:hypothetical protein